MEENVRLVKQLFFAFGQGDLKTVLGILTDDVDWQSLVTRTKHEELSWAKPRHGREQVAQFLKELGGKVKPEPFEDLVFTAQDDRVVVEGRNRGTVIATNLTYEQDWVMTFTIRQNKICRHRGYYDTVDVSSAFHPK